MNHYDCSPGHFRNFFFFLNLLSLSLLSFFFLLLHLFLPLVFPPPYPPLFSPLPFSLDSFSNPPLQGTPRDKRRGEIQTAGRPAGIPLKCYDGRLRVSLFLLPSLLVKRGGHLCPFSFARLRRTCGSVASAPLSTPQKKRNPSTRPPPLNVPPRCVRLRPTAPSGSDRLRTPEAHFQLRSAKLLRLSSPRPQAPASRPIQPKRNPLLMSAIFYYSSAFGAQARDRLID